MPPANKHDEDEEQDDEKPGWKDYVAIAIAMLQTLFLPMVVGIVLLVILVLVLRLA